MNSLDNNKDLLEVAKRPGDFQAALVRAMVAMATKCKESFELEDDLQCLQLLHELVESIRSQERP